MFQLNKDKLLMSVDINYINRADLDFNIRFKEGWINSNSLFSYETSGNITSYGLIDKNFNGKSVNVKKNEIINTEAISNYDRTSALVKHKDIAIIRMQHSNWAEFDLRYDVVTIFMIVVMNLPNLRLKLHHLWCWSKENIKSFIDFIRSFSTYKFNIEVVIILQINKNKTKKKLNYRNIIIFF